jgi:hypothetical protein
MAIADIMTTPNLAALKKGEKIPPFRSRHDPRQIWHLCWTPLSPFQRSHNATNALIAPAGLVNERNTGLGLWRGDFVPPWDWRQGARLDAKEALPQCAI